MPFTVKNFLDLDIISPAKIVTNEDTINNKTVESISVMELPVENFVHKNELVLTTCMGCTNNDSVFLDFARDIYNSGASCLVVSIGRYVKYTPQVVIDFANEVNFPIIQIPWEIRFAGITETVIHELNSTKRANIDVYEGIQKKLLTLFLDGSTLSEAADLIYKELGNQAVIINSLGTVEGASSKAQNLFAVIQQPLNILFSGKNLEQLKSFDMKDVYTVYKISSKNMTYGYLYLKTKSEDSENDYVKDNKTLVVRYIVSAITLWFDRERTIFETEMHHKDKFVWNLIQADDREIHELYNQSSSLGYNLTLSYICIVGMISNFEKSYNLERSKFSSFEEWKFSCIKDIKSQIIRISPTIDQEVMVTYQEEKLIIFIEHKDCNIEGFSNKFIDIIESRIKSIYPKLVISWGIGSDKADYLNFNKVYLDAKISLQIGYNSSEPGFRNIYYNTSIYRLLSILLNDDETHHIINSLLGKLLEYDEENGLDLINTFKTYRKNEGNVSQTARDLHLHRQSLLYRLKRIEDIVQISLDKADDVFLLDLCIRLWDKKNDLII